MLVLIDQSLRDFIHLRTIDERRYFIHRNKLLLVVDRGDCFKEGALIDANVGWDQGTRGFVIYEGQKHSKLTCYREVKEGKPKMGLSQILAKSPNPERE